MKREQVSAAAGKLARTRAPRPELSRTERIDIIDREIRSGARPNRQMLADACATTVRTIQRDVIFMIGRGAPIEYDAMGQGYYYTHKNYNPLGVRLTAQDLFTLAIAQLAMQEYKATPVANELKQIYLKFLTRAPKGNAQDYRVDPDRLMADFSFVTRARRPPNPAIWTQVVDGLRDRRSVRIQYRGRTDTDHRERMIDPHHVASIEGDWYVFARDHKSNEIRQWVMSRIKSARVTLAPFVRDPDFDARRVLSESFGRFAHSKNLETVRVWIAREAADWVQERQWHDRQTFDVRADGSVELSFPVSGAGPSPFLHVKSWVLSLGRHAKVLAPDRLRELVREELDAMKAHHQPNKK